MHSLLFSVVILDVRYIDKFLRGLRKMLVVANWRPFDQGLPLVSYSPLNRLIRVIAREWWEPWKGSLCERVLAAKEVSSELMDSGENARLLKISSVLVEGRYLPKSGLLFYVSEYVNGLSLSRSLTLCVCPRKVRCYTSYWIKNRTSCKFCQSQARVPD